MAIVCLRVPSGICSALENVGGVPGDPLSASDMHVTLVHFEDSSIENLARVMVAVYNAASVANPFQCEIREITNFPDKDGVFPIICPLDSPSLHIVRVHIASEFVRLGIEYSTNFPEFKPHVTLAYAEQAHNANLPAPFTWTATEISIWGGGGPSDTLTVSVPLSLDPLKDIARRLVPLS